MVLMMMIARLQREQGHCLENDNVLMMMVMMRMVLTRIFEDDNGANDDD